MKNLALGLTTVFLASAVCSSSVAGGGMEGGGGVGVRCGTKLELLDLHEARLNGLKFEAAPKTDTAAINFIAHKLATHFIWLDYNFAYEFENLRSMFANEIAAPIFNGGDYFFPIKLNGGVHYVMGESRWVSALPLSNDIGEYKIKPGCNLEQVAYMTGGRLEIVKSRWVELDGLSRAALAAHEAIYLMYREMGLDNLNKMSGPETSVSTRQFVGSLVSNQPPPALLNGVSKNTKVKYCSSGSDEFLTSFVITKLPKGFRVIYEHIHGMNDPYQLTSDFDNNGTELSAVVKRSGSATLTNLKVILTRTPGKDGFKFALFDTKPAQPSKVGATANIACWNLD